MRAVRSNPGISRADRSPALAALGRKCDESGEIVLVQAEASLETGCLVGSFTQRFAQPAR